MKDNRSGSREAYSAAVLSYDMGKGGGEADIPLGKIHVRNDVELEYA